MFIKYIYPEYLSQHWMDLINMVEHNYSRDLGLKDSLIVGACALHSVDTYRKKYDGADRYIVYQLEPLHENHWYPAQKIISHLLNADEVWDYDLDNIEILKQHGIDAKFKPFLYTPNLKRIKNKEHPDIDILFYGSLNKVRSEIINCFCNHGVNNESITILFNHQGSKLDEYISRSKIILNLHTDQENTVQKQTRLFYGLINDKCIISEESKRNYYGDLIVESKRTELVSTVLKYIRNGSWKTQSQKTAEKFKSFTLNDLFLNSKRGHLFPDSNSC